MSDGSELMHSHKYIQKYQKNGKTYYVYDEDRGDKNLVSAKTYSANGSVYAGEYTYNKDINDRNEKEYKITTKIKNAAAGAAKSATNTVKSATNTVNDTVKSATNTVKTALHPIADKLGHNEKDEYTYYLNELNKQRSFSNLGQALTFSINTREKAYEHAVAYSKTPIGKLDIAVYTAKSWVADKLKKSK
jgi:hypothetical protein